MKKILFLLLALIPFIGIAQTKNVLTAQRVFPKMDKVLEFEKALAAHAQKYHSGDVSWRVFEIQSGPDAGGFMISEGPPPGKRLTPGATSLQNTRWIGIKMCVFISPTGCPLPTRFSRIR